MNPIRSCLQSFSFSIFRLILILLIVISSSKNAATGQPVANSCLNSAYDPVVDTGYAANLNSLLSSLSSNATSSRNATNFDFYLCQGDVNTTDCQACVQTASKEILTEYSNDTAAIVWYVNCLLRYSNQKAFPDIRLFLSNTQSSTDPESFNDYVGNMMNDLAIQASSDVSGGKFAVQEGNSSVFPKLFSLAQCIPGLSNSDCNICLREAMTMLPTCCNGSLGARILSPSCNIRYEKYQFYNVVPAPAPLDNFPNPPAPLHNSPNPPAPTKNGKKSTSAPIIISVVLIVVVVIMLVAFVRLRKRSKARNISRDGEEIPTVESLNYSLSQVQNATNNFSEDCKIGHGGFGPVYKGTLPNGEEVAMKRLSQSSVQGLEEFKNEIVLLARLQHRNLVRLLGFCFENQEMIIIYEYFHNKSLDHFLFDPEKRRLLDWTTRYKIIVGIARGLLYLHEDSRIRIIHRDLKPSNVLLDDNMNPKIADFGTARLLQVDQSEENTRRIAGTYGYMAPEYAMYGHISVKSDVFSFGVLLLEIISGKRSTTYYESDGVDDLLRHAWKNFRNGIPLALLDPSVGELYARNEVIQCIQIGLLCIQDDAELRPKMDSVVQMLRNNFVTLPTPLQPTFFTTSRTTTENTLQPEQSDTSTNKSSSHSVSGKDASFTELFPR